MQAAESLGRLKDSNALPSLTQALSDSALTVRLTSVVAIGRIRDVKAAPSLMKVLDDRSAP